MKYQFASLLLLLSFSLKGQDQLLLTTEKSFEGKIKIDRASEGHETITVKVGKNKTKLQAHEFKYFIKDDEKYVPFKLGQYYKIMKVEIEGYLSLYYYRDGTYDFGTQYLHKLDGQGITVPNISFKKRISEYLNDCPQIETGLNTGEYKKTELNKIVTDYNGCIKQKTIQTRMSKPDLSEDKISLIDKIDQVISKIGDGNEELKTLLADIQTKLAEGKSIPGYLKSALMEQSKNVPDLSEEITQLLNSF